MDNKICTRCSLPKPISRFGKRYTKYGEERRRSICRDCDTDQAREWRDKNRSRYRDTYLKREYGISNEDYESMRESQNNCCAICGIHETKAITGILHLDHCHNTGTVRGLLCVACNTALGKVNDDPKILERMIEYLRR